MSGWRCEQVEGLRLKRCSALESIPGIAHAFSTRTADGGSDFDLGSSQTPSAEIAARRERLLDAAGLAGLAPLILHQVHGKTIVEPAAPERVPPEADGAILVVARDRGRMMAPAVRSADCVPILIADRAGTVVGAVHAGWRGVAAGIAPAAVARFASHGISVGDLVVALGPAIGRCCYEVGPEVVSALRGSHTDDAAFTPAASGKAKVDLRALIRAQLMASGVSPACVHEAPWCTRCRADLFFSYRAEGTAAGRLMAVIGHRLQP